MEKCEKKHTGLFIPEELFRLWKLNPIEQMLLVTIDSLDHGPNNCFASNKYLANSFGLSESRISYYITKFRKLGLIEFISFDGRMRKLKSLKSRWFQDPETNSKNTLYVKTRRQTTRKQEGRLRENKKHTKVVYENSLSLKETNKEKDVHKLNSSSPSASPADSSIPLNKKHDFVSFSSDEDDTVKILEMESRYEKHFRPPIVARWIKKFGASRVLEEINNFFYTIHRQKKPILKPEAWMEKAFLRNYAATAKTAELNKKCAIELKKKYALGNLKINKRYCKDMRTGNDYCYDLPKESFLEALKRVVEWGGTGH